MHYQDDQQCAKYNDLCDIDDQESCKCDTVWNLSCTFIAGMQQYRCISVNYGQNPGLLPGAGVPHGAGTPPDLPFPPPTVTVAEPSTKRPPSRKHPQKPGKKRRQKTKARIWRKHSRIFTW